jgi:uncharacterized membrane protein
MHATVDGPRGVFVAMGTKNIGLIVGVVLIVLGVVLMLITEPAGEEGSQASGGVADASEDTRPYVWYGLVALVLGIVVAVLAWLKGKPAEG